MKNRYDIMNHVKLLESAYLGELEYVNPKASDSISYRMEDGQKGMKKVIATLKSYDSARYTKMGRDLARIEQIEEELKALKASVKQDSRELVQDLFNAEDTIHTRVVETVSFIFEMTKDPKPTESYQYAKILDELQASFTPELMKLYEDTKQKFKTVTQKAPALSYTDTGVAEPKPMGDSIDASINEGIWDKIKAFGSKYLSMVNNWARKYDSRLDALKAEAGISESILPEDEADEAFGDRAYAYMHSPGYSSRKFEKEIAQQFSGIPHFGDHIGEGKTFTVSVGSGAEAKSYTVTIAPVAPGV